MYDLHVHVLYKCMFYKFARPLHHMQFYVASFSWINGECTSSTLYSKSYMYTVDDSNANNYVTLGSTLEKVPQYSPRGEYMYMYYGVKN